MPVKFEFRGVTYSNAVELGNNLPLLTSVLVGWTDAAEVICANAAAICYDTPLSYEMHVDKDLIKEMLDRDDFSQLWKAVRYEVNNRGKNILKHCRDSQHNTVLEHGLATFVKKVPIFVARQDLRARIASFDERSLRYCRADDGSLTYYIPDYLSEEAIAKVKDDDQRKYLQYMRDYWIDVHERAIWLYSMFTDEELNGLINVGKERVQETARAVLPLGINTIYIDTRNLWSWVHHSVKRLCLRAQKEIRMMRMQEVRQLRQVFPTIFGEVNMPCYMAVGCTEARPCGLIELDEAGFAKKYKSCMVRKGIAP